MYFWVQGQPGQQSEFQDSQGYTEKPCLEKTKRKNANKSSFYALTDKWILAQKLGIPKIQFVKHKKIKKEDQSVDPS